MKATANHTKPKQFLDQALDQLRDQLRGGKTATLRAYLCMLDQMRNYSVNNILLIATQCPHARLVYGFQTWRRHDRSVKKGEKAIRIVAPLVHRKRDDQEDEEAVHGFRYVSVFDISQTHGKPLPAPAVQTGNPGQYTQRLTEYIRRQSIAIATLPATASADGESHGGRISIRKGLTPAEEFATLVHELAHERMHRNRQDLPEKAIRETEAEAVAFAVCRAIGLKTTQAAADYIHLARGGEKKLMQSLDAIRTTAHEIIAALRPPAACQSTIQEQSP